MKLDKYKNTKTIDFKEFLSNYKDQKERKHKLESKVIPVPVTQNKFDLELKARTDIEFTYELRDGNGNKIHEIPSLNMNKGEQKMKTINPSGNIPFGVMVHRFIFSNGTIKELKTLKR